MDLVGYDFSDNSDIEELEGEEDQGSISVISDTVDNHEISINENGEITIALNKNNGSNGNGNNKKRTLDKLYENDETTVTTTATTETTTTTTTTIISKIGDTCNVCNIDKSKYKCPGCRILFCSLVCSTKHKTDTKCTGVRKDNHFIPLNKFKDSDIVNDFNFLDKINRVNENGKAIVANSFIKFKSKHLQQFAFRKNINLYIMPKEMSRHKDNTTTFKKNNKNSIQWRIEWLFLDDDFKLIDQSIQDTTIISELLHKHIDDPINIYNIKNILKKYNSNRNCVDANENFTILMKRERDSKNQYYKFDLNKSFDDNFQFKEIIEYPTLLLFTSNSSLLSNYNIIPPQDIPAIEKQQQEIIKTNLCFKTKYDPNLTNTEDQSKRILKYNETTVNRNNKKTYNNKFKNNNNNNNNSKKEPINTTSKNDDS